MKILAVANNKDFYGGANRSLYMVLVGLKEKYGFDIDVLVPGKNGEFEKEISKKGIKCYTYMYSGVISACRNDGKDLLRKIKVWVSYFWENLLGNYLAYKFKNNNYDLIYTNTRFPAVGAVIAKKLKIKHVCHIREFCSTKPIWGKWKSKEIYKNSDKIICISQALYEQIEKEVPKDKLIMIHNGIDGDIGINCNEILNKDFINIILTGRIVPDKGHMDAIDALKILKNKGYNKIFLNIVGNSPASGRLDWYKRKLENKIKEYDLSDNISFLGEIKDMIEIRKNVDIELMCAIKETFGRVTVEGMRNGLCVIGSNTGGTVEIIDDKNNGFLYKQGNGQSLADVIEYVLDNKAIAKKVAKNGYEFSQTHFLPEDNIDKIYKVLNSM